MEYNLHIILLGLINTNAEKLFRTSEKENLTGTTNIYQESVQDSVSKQNGALCRLNQCTTSETNSKFTEHFK